MTYSDFKQSVVSFLCKNLGNHAKISIRPVLKNNHVQYDGLIILENGSNISPTIYLNYYYRLLQKKTPLSEILSQILDTYLANKPDTTIDTSFFTDYNNICPHIAYKLIHASLNEHLLNDIPHKKILDLAIVFYCLLSGSEHENATILIRNRHLALWGVEPEIIYSQALSNTPSLLPPTLHDMNSLLFNRKDFNRADVPKAVPSMYILSNPQKLYGASAMLYPGVLEDFSATVNGSFYILPSSIHEVILLPESSKSVSGTLNKMVQEVNLSQVSPEEVLSDHAYYYSLEERSIKILS